MSAFYNEFAVAVALVIIGFYWYLKYLSEKRQYLKSIPGPPTLPILGNALDFKSTKEMLATICNYNKTYGDLVKVQIGPLQQFLLISDYELLEFVFNSNKLSTKANEYKFFFNWLGNGLLVSDGPKWKSHRRILTPTFHFKILESFVKVFENADDVLIRKLKAEIDKDSFDIYPYITLCTLDIICESAMGTSVNAQENEDCDYVQAVRTMCRIVMERSLSPLEMYDFPYQFTSNCAQEKKALRILHDYTDSVIKSRRELLKTRAKIDFEGDPEINSKDKLAFLDLLLEARIDGAPLSDKDIRDEVDTFMFEGHDTTSSAISFALYSLSNHPEIQEEAFQEQKSLFGNDLTKVPSYQQFQEMKYLELVIKETLRLYPSVPFFAREVKENIEYNGITLPAGITLVLFAFGIQRSPKYFTNPDDFDPIRFQSAETKPFSNIPFSAGPRNCIGQKFAILELKSVLSRILRNFELLPTNPKHELQLKSETILKSDNGIKLKLRNRVY